MLRPIALALLCLSLVGALLAVRTTIAARAIAEPAASEAAPEADDDSPPLAKSDRLPMVDLEAKSVPVIPIEVAPAEKNAAETLKETKLQETPTLETKPTETPKAETRPKETPKAEAKPKEAKADETISWHWHVGSKISKRTGKPVQ